MNDKKYFERKIPEEDYPYEFEDEVHEKYKKLETVYEEFFEESSIASAKVIRF